MAVKTKSDLREYFNEPASLLFQKADFVFEAGQAVINPDYDLPVHVDDLTLSQDAPTINHYKVIGLQGDWASTSEEGDFNVNFFVPSTHSDVYKLAYGDGAVTSVIDTSNICNPDGFPVSDYLNGNWEGFSVDLKKHKVTGNFALVNADETHVVLFRGVTLYASHEWADTSLAPIGLRFTGTIENDGSGKNVIHLKKKSA